MENYSQPGAAAVSLKHDARDIYARSLDLPTSSERTRYRQRAVAEYPKTDRWMMAAYMDQIKARRIEAGRTKLLRSKDFW